MKPKEAVECHRILFCDADARARLVVVVVLDGRNEREAIGSAAEEDDDERLLLVAIAGDQSLRRIRWTRR